MQVRGPPPVMTMGSPVVIMQQAPPQQITYAQQGYGQPQQGYQSTTVQYQQPATYQQGYTSENTRRTHPTIRAKMIVTVTASCTPMS